MENYLDYNFLAQKAHENAIKHGFWDERRSSEHCLMLIVTEISEIVEADRKGRHADIEKFKALQSVVDDFTIAFESHIKNSIEDEMADVVIRLADQAGAEGIDFDKMLPSRYYRTFGNYSLTENAFALVKGLCKETINLHKRIQWGLQYVRSWADSMHINLAWHIEQKMRFNATRERKHGKQY